MNHVQTETGALPCHEKQEPPFVRFIDTLITGVRRSRSSMEVIALCRAYAEMEAAGGFNYGGDDEHVG